MLPQRKRYRIGISTTWYGQELKGGAESQARELALKLSSAGHKVTVLTSCSEGFTGSWDRDFWSPGLSMDAAVEVLRFPLGKRDPSTFNRIVRNLLNIPDKHLIPGFNPISIQDEAHYWSENANSPALIDWIAEHQHVFDFVIFIPYLFPLAWDGVRQLGKKALLQPCLHDEAYAYLSACQKMAGICGGLLFNSRGEYELARGIFGQEISYKSFVVGEGIDFLTATEPPPSTDFLRKAGTRFILYLGRRCQEKNTWELVSAFQNFRKGQNADLRLILAGSGHVPPQQLTEGITDLGQVQDSEKLWLLRNSLALAVPGKNESFSRVMFESWHEGRPVIVNGECLATREAVKDSGSGGWITGPQKTWEDIFHDIAASSSETLAAMGNSGRDYCQNTCAWPEVIRRYEDVFQRLSFPRPETETQATENRTLLILPWPKAVPSWCRKDLSAIIRVLRQTSHEPVELLFRGNASAVTEGLRPQSLENCLKRPPHHWSRIFWYSEDPWEDASALISELRAQKYRRLLLPFTTKSNHSDNTQFDRLLSPFSQQAGTDCLPYLDLAEVRPELHIGSSHRKTLMQKGLNISLISADHPSARQALTALIQEVPEENKKHLHFMLPDIRTCSPRHMEELSHCLPPDHYTVIRKEDTFAEYFALSEVLLVIGDPLEQLSEIYQALSLALPVCCLHSPVLATLLDLPDFSCGMNTGPSDISRAWDHIHSCGTDPDLCLHMRTKSAAVIQRSLLRGSDESVRELLQL
ncbi:MAG: glycosyltransferase family 4 protein [Deltaproteobacteria bacterium]|nr:glycosyltransferase family 4 protein [Deltaproteobacteria bacterium]